MRELMDSAVAAMSSQADAAASTEALTAPTSATVELTETRAPGAETPAFRFDSSNDPIVMEIPRGPRQATSPAPASLVPLRARKEKRVQRRVKRALDVVIALIVLAIIAPLLAVIAIAIKLDSPGPVIYRQQRAGEGGRLFTMYKFRSMRQDADDLMPAYLQLNEQRGPLFKIRDDPRKTRVGRILRRLSLDEVPQLVNVLFGDLSLVGPRPPLASELDAYEWGHWQRLTTPQGLTGLWQVSGRSLLDFDQMLALDIEYIASWSLFADLRILLRTVPTVISGRGAF